ncbi:MAG TPA: tRNA uridine-5-carboxymethylaminomethyl(34) synthesis GTPase MnmE [Candidatus Omnitrophica bacterium]|nr:tRNA uridine-5-carboxymethylaminomethyl(34) synthesis GTPase MnmE [Candidatus Omnitrophota bacterium]
MEKILTESATIAAIATPFGEGAVGIVRLSGPQAVDIAGKVFRAKSKKPFTSQKSFSFRYGWIVKDSGEALDEVIVSLMRAPKSYTREDVVEINSHGGPCALSGILELVCAAGARIAGPGEFTKRAFLNGRLDLAQAEAVLDVIQAKSELARKNSLSQLSGEVSRRVGELRADILGLLADMEAGIDFSEDDVAAVDIPAYCNRLDGICLKLGFMLEHSFKGRMIREGLKAVIYGRPNVGKSSLLNAVLKEERAIVTSIAGTTRDTVEEFINIKGLAVRLIDTAGILEHRDDIEKEALGRTKRALETSDVVIFVLDGSSPLTKEDRELAAHIAGKRTIVVINKCDLTEGIDKSEVASIFSQEPLCVSAQSGAHIHELEDLVYKSVFPAKGVGTGVFQEGALVSNARHIEILKSAQRSLEQARSTIAEGLSCEFASPEVKNALDSLGMLTGEVFSDGLLDEIFSKFCIGK